jgi:hypothetical protein
MTLSRQAGTISSKLRLKQSKKCRRRHYLAASITYFQYKLRALFRSPAGVISLEQVDSRSTEN